MYSVVKRIQGFNQGRDPGLLALKYKAMRADAFAFFRGTCHLFYEDWPGTSPLNKAPLAWICGDLHLENFGSYRGDNRLVYFGINDFDEAVLAPCTWDIARLLTSILMAAAVIHIPQDKAERLCTSFLATYCKTLARGSIRILDSQNTKGPVKTLLRQDEQRHRADFLQAHTQLVGTQRHLKLSHPTLTAISDEEKARVSNIIEQWGASQTNPSFFHVLDVAHRVAGIGSMGVQRYAILVEGKGSPDQNYLLDLKAEADSSLQPYLTFPQPRWANQALRVVSAQRWIQSVPPALLAALQMNGQNYVLRELQPVEDKINLAAIQGKFSAMKKLVNVLAKATASGELHSAGHQEAESAYELIDFAQQDTWQQPLLDYVKFYATQVQKDYQEFCTAYDNGVFKNSY